MALSVLDIFKIGIGPSSSHTVGPMIAARQFVHDLEMGRRLEETRQIAIELYGSLAMTGRGHGTDRAVMLGLEDHQPHSIDPEIIESTISRFRMLGRLRLLGRHEIEFDEPLDLMFRSGQALPGHPNGLRFSALDCRCDVIFEEEFYSVGGGFVQRVVDIGKSSDESASFAVPYPFNTSRELLEQACKTGVPLHEIALVNESAWRSPAETHAALLNIWQVMQSCIDRGFRSSGTFPGALGLKRRAPGLLKQLAQSSNADAASVMDWVSAFAIAVNEENAAGGRVVTAPTNGAAGVVPAVLMYFSRFEPSASEDGILRFLLVAGAIGMLYKISASISGAEMGCQGEVGVACSMAAGGLVAAVNGSNEQIENAAEIGMEHNLGLTCDPVAGLVQIPCIERNAMGAVKAINAARLALRGDGIHKVSLDQVIITMRQTGRDMSSIYKETSQGGLAVNVPEC